MIEDLQNISLTRVSSIYHKDVREIKFNTVLKGIKKGDSKDVIKQVRKGRKDLKPKLPGDVFGGYFKDRTTLIKPSGLACVDYDKVKSLKYLIAELKKSKFILAFWLSPSGNGLKALVRIPLVKSKAEYKQYYLAILKEFERFNPDPSTKDMNRLCFQSYDPNLYFNKNALVFTKKIEFPKTECTINPNAIQLSEGKKIDRILKWWMKNYGFNEGQRNNNLFILACSMSEFGISESITEDLLDSFVSEDFNQSEIKTLIKSAYLKTQFNSKSFSS